MVNDGVGGAKVVWGQCVNFFLFFMLGFNFIGINALQISPLVVYLTRGLVVCFLVVGLFNGFAIRRDEFFSVLFCAFCFLVGGGGNYIAANMLFSLIFVFFMAKSRFEDVINGAFWVLFLSLLFVFLLLFAGVLENSVDLVGERSRATFGFVNTNAFASLLYSFVLLMILHWRGLVLFKYGVIILISFWAYNLTDNRSVLIALVLYFAIRFFLCFIPPGRRLNSVVAGVLLLPILLTQLSEYISQEYPWVDVLLSMRLSLSAQFMNELPWYSHLIGGVSPDKFKTVDNSFLLMQGALGVPFMMYLFWKTFSAFRYFCKVEMLDVCALIVSFWYFCFSESNLVRPETVFALVFLQTIFRGANRVVYLK
ncbi:hypothetical protein [Crenobacter luteus]|uniref:hypothetical protein n=1 Tax=Crenobacter luteus TaxID=1452487 RepID=UPI0012E90278|nr:hypothetical protein [Crenobacter luteus]